MAAKVTFDSANKIIQVTQAPVGGEVSLDFKIDVYSDGKEDWLADEALSRFRFPIRAVGGDALPGSKALGSTFFLQYGWKLRPYSADHTLTLNGNVYSSDGSSPFVSAVGSYSIAIISQVSQLVDSTVQQLPEIEYSSFNGGVTIDVLLGVSGTEYPTGTAARPSNNLTDAQTIAVARGFKVLFIIGDLTIAAGESISYYTLRGQDRDSSMLTLTAGNTTTGANLYDLEVTGTCGGRMNLHDCHLRDVSGLCASGGNANLVRCHLMNDIQFRSLADQSFNFIDCVGAIGVDSPTIDINGCSADIHFSTYSGPLTLEGGTVAGQEIAVGVSSGTITLDATMTQGNIFIRGLTKFTNQTTPQTGLNIDVTGMVNLEQLEYSSFAGGVTIDVVNGVAGTAFPLGTPSHPVSNLADAKTIAAYRGFVHLYVRGNLTIGATDSVSNYHVHGDGATLNITKTLITLTAGCTTSNAHWYDCRITGQQGGESIYRDCIIDGLSNAHCAFIHCGFLTPTGAYTMQQSSSIGGTHIVDLHECYSDEGTVVIDRNGTQLQQAWFNYGGRIKFTNQNRSSSSGTTWIHMVGGTVTIDSSCTTGAFVVSGNCTVINESGGSTVSTAEVAGSYDEADGIESGVTPRSALRIMLAALAGKLSGAPAGPVVIRNVGDTKDRITATVDSDGNRTAVAVDGA